MRVGWGGQIDRGQIGTAGASAHRAGAEGGRPDRARPRPGEGDVKCAPGIGPPEGRHYGTAIMSVYREELDKSPGSRRLIGARSVHPQAKEASVGAAAPLQAERAHPAGERITPSRIALSPGYGDKTKAVPARHGRRAKVAVKIRGDNRQRAFDQAILIGHTGSYAPYGPGPGVASFVIVRLGPRPTSRDRRPSGEASDGLHLALGDGGGRSP